MSFHDRFNGGQPSYNNNNSSQIQDLGQGTVNETRHVLQQIITEMSNQSPAAYRVYNDCQSNRQRFEALLMSALYLLHFKINNGGVDANASNSMVISEVCTEAAVIRQIKELEKDRVLLQQVADTAPQQYDLLRQVRNAMLNLSARVNEWVAWLKNQNRTFAGFQGTERDSFDTRFGVNTQQQPSLAMDNRPLTLPGQTGGGGLGTERIFQPTAPAIQTRGQAELSARFDYDDAPVQELSMQREEPTLSLHGGSSRRQAPPVEVHPRDAAPGMQDVYDLAQRFADDDDRHFHQEDEDPSWDPLAVSFDDAKPAQKANEISYDESQYGPVVRMEEYIALRLTATKFDLDQPWPYAYDPTAFARRAYVDKTGLLHETIVPLSTLSETEMEYTELETDPEARRQAELAHLKLSAVSQREPIVVTQSNAPEDKPVVVGEDRDMELVILSEMITASSDSSSEAKASIAAIAQTGQDINQTDALAWCANLVEHLGVYTNIAEFGEFLDAFDVSSLGRDEVSACAAALVKMKGQVPERIWHAVNNRATVEVNQWVKRLKPCDEPVNIDSFAEDIQDLLSYLVKEEGYEREWLTRNLQATGTEWLRALKCLHASPDGVGHWNLRLEIASMFDMLGYMAETENFMNAQHAARIKFNDELRTALAADEELSEDERDARQKEEMDKFIASEKELPLSEDVTEVWWFNHSVFMQSAHVALRIPSTARDLALNRYGYSHASAATNPALATLLVRTFEAFESQVIGLRRVCVYLGDGSRVYAHRINAAAGAQEFLLERV